MPQWESAPVVDEPAWSKAPVVDAPAWASAPEASGDESADVAEPLLKSAEKISDVAARNKTSAGDRWLLKQEPLIDAAQSVGRDLSNPIDYAINLPNRLTGQPDFNPLLSPEQGVKLAKFFSPVVSSEGSVAQGVENFAGKMASGMSTPGNIAGIIAGTKYPQVVGSIYQGIMAADLPATLDRLRKAGSTSEQIEESLNALASMGMITAIQKHAEVGKPLPKAWERVEPTVKEPATVEPVTQELHIEELPNGLRVSGLGVRSDQRGKGIGTAKMQEVIDRSDETGKPIYLTAHANSVAEQPALNRFYERLGFTQYRTDPLSGKPMYRYDPAEPKAAEPALEKGGESNGQENQRQKEGQEVAPTAAEIKPPSPVQPPLWAEAPEVKSASEDIKPNARLAANFPIQEPYSDKYSVSIQVAGTDVSGVSKESIRDSLPKELQDKLVNVQKFRGDIVPTDPRLSVPARIQMTFPDKKSAQAAIDHFKGTPKALVQGPEAAPSKASKEFDALVHEHGMQMDWVKDPDALYAQIGKTDNTASIKAKIEQGKALAQARRNAALDLGANPDSADTAAGRAALLDKLKAHIEDQSASDNLPDQPGASPEFLPPDEPLPKLRSMENQGDLLSTQTEPFALTGEKGTDVERAQAAQALKERNAIDAKAIMDRQQQTLPLASVSPIKLDWKQNIANEVADKVKRGIIRKEHGDAIIAANKLPPPTLVAEPAPVTPGPEASRMGITPFASPAGSSMLSDITQGITGAWNGLGTAIRTIAGETYPKITEAHRPAGEALANFAASTQFAEPSADMFTFRVLHGSGLSERMFGAMMTEDQLRGTKASLRERAMAAARAGDANAATKLAEAAANVRTMVGARNFPFATEAAYRTAWSTREALNTAAIYKALAESEIDPLHREAARLAPDTELPVFGERSGAHMSLKSAEPGETGSSVVRPATGNLKATLQRRSVFSRQRTGAGESYDIDFGQIMRNKFSKEITVANHNKAINTLVEGGQAVIGSFPKAPEIEGKPSVPFPLKYPVMLKGENGTSFKAGENIYVRADLASEFRNAMNTDAAVNPWKPVKVVIDAWNKSSLVGLSEGTAHVINQISTILGSPATSAMAKLAMRSDVLGVAGKFAKAAALDIRDRAVLNSKALWSQKAVTEAANRHLEQLSSIAALSEVGAGRAKFPTGKLGNVNPLNWGTAGIHWFDKTFRVMMNDVFDQMVRDNKFEDNQTNRREFVNQGLQYNKQMQHVFVRVMRDLGASPFATAGLAMNSRALSLATLAGARPKSPMARAALIGNVASGVLGAFVLRGTLNYLTTGKAMGRPGTPIKNFDTGKDDKNGKHITFDIITTLGYGRTMRMTGLSGYIDAKRNGLPSSVAGEKAVTDVVNAQLSPWLGPFIRGLAIAGTGSAPLLGENIPLVPNAGPDQNKWMSFNGGYPDGRVPYALAEASPLMGSIYEHYKLDRPWDEVLARQGSKFAPQFGPSTTQVQNMPERVHGARLNDWIDDVARRARHDAPNDRFGFAQKEMEKAGIEGADKKKALDAFKRKFRFAQ